MTMLPTGNVSYQGRITHRQVVGNAGSISSEVDILPPLSTADAYSYLTDLTEQTLNNRRMSIVWQPRSLTILASLKSFP